MLSADARVSSTSQADFFSRSGVKRDDPLCHVAWYGTQPCGRLNQRASHELSTVCRLLLALLEKLCRITLKNSLFAGADGGARTWAAIATLLQTCKMNEFDPVAWLPLCNATPISGPVLTSMP